MSCINLAITSSKSKIGLGGDYMMQKAWFKFFIWFMSTFFFFLVAGVIISLFKPGPTEIEVMRFKEGFMSAMSQSLMGISMGFESDRMLKSIIKLSAVIISPMIILGILAGFAIRVKQRRDNDV